MNPIPSHTLNKDMLAALCKTPGLPGRETLVSDLICKNLPPHVQITQDRLGNVIAHQPGEGECLVMIAHMDEVGLIVRRVTPEGFILVERLGGINTLALPGSNLSLWTERGCLPARVGLLPQHLADNSAPNLDKIFIDIGAASKSEVFRLGVQIGDGLTWDSPLLQSSNDWISGKALDNRLGCCALLSIANHILPGSTPLDLYFVFIVQEETSTSCAMPAIRTIRPDYVLGIDCTLAFDTPDLLNQQSEIVTGCGPTIKLMDTIRGKSGTYLPDWNLVKYIQNISGQNNIPLQAELISGLTTAVNQLPFAENGIKTAALSIPLRYHHSPVESARISDVEYLINLLEIIISQPLNP